MAGEKGGVGEDEIIKGTIAAGSPCGWLFRMSRSGGDRGPSPRTQTAAGGGQGERVLRTEMKPLGESESRRSGAGEHRRRREQAGVLRGSSRREDRETWCGASSACGSRPRSIGSLASAKRIVCCRIESVPEELEEVTSKTLGEKFLKRSI